MNTQNDIQIDENNNEFNNKKRHKFKFKFPEAYVLLFFMLVFFTLLSWILYWSNVNYTKLDDNDNEVVEKIKAFGILDIFWAIVQAFIDKAEILAFIFVLGGFIAITFETKCLEAFMQLISRKFAKTRWISVPLLITFFSFSGATYGMDTEAMGFYVILITLFLSAGYDKMSAVFLIIFSVAAGNYASTTNPFLVGSALNNGKINCDGPIFRWIGWLAVTTMTAIFVLSYMHYIKKHPSKSITFSTLEADKKFYLSEKQEEIVFDWKKIITLIIFVFAFLLLSVYVIAWDKLFGVNGLENFAQLIREKFPYLTSIFKGIGSEDASLEMSAIILFLGLIIGFINWQGADHFFTTYASGAKRIIGVVFILAMGAAVGILLEETGILHLITGGLSKNMVKLSRLPFLLITFFAFLPLAFVIPSTSAFTSAIFPIWGPLATTLGAGSASIIAYSYANGIVNLINPASSMIMIMTATAGIKYTTFIKSAWKYILALFILALTLITIGAYLPSIC